MPWRELPGRGQRLCPRARAPRVAVAVAALVAAGACSNSAPGGGHNTSVFSVKPGECFYPPAKVQAELTKVDQVPCTSGHTQEAYAIVSYKAPAGASTTDYPGDKALMQYADGVCAAHFSAYVGTDYQDSSLFFTYLVPSARGWQEGHDRHIVCFITTNGSVLHRSVKNAKI